MAENKEGQEKTEEPTAKRLRDAREKGQVPRSREFNTFFMMLISAGGLLVLGPGMMEDLMNLLREHFRIERYEIFDTQFLILKLESGFIDSLILMTPFFLLAIAVAIASSLVIGGWNFSMKAMAFRGSRMSPITGIKRIFGPQGLMELAKAIAKVVLVGGVAVGLLIWQGDAVLALGYQSLETAMAEMGEQLMWFFLALSASLIVVAAIDAPFQLWNNRNQLKMSKQEVKQEHKQQEGSPEVKNRIRKIQLEMSQRRMMQKVPEADVVITNPTHYAVALKYDQSRDGAPILVAKGSDLLAGKIREKAREHGVPIVSSPALARALYHSTDLDAEIPTGLYVAVAKILAYVFSLRRKPGTVFSSQLAFNDVEIPDELRRDD